MASLGNHSLILSTDATGLIAGMDRVRNKVQQTKQQVEKTWASNPIGKLKDTITSGLKGGAKSLLTGATIGVASAVTGRLIEGIESPFDRVKELAKQGTIATSLGLTPEQFTGIAGAAKAAGSDTKDFLEGLITLSSRGREALAGASEIATQMFSKLNISAADFVKLNPEQQFYKLFDAIQNVKNPAEQVDLLLKAFGEDTGKNLVGLLGKSSAELHKMADLYAVSTEKIARAQLASEAFTEAQAKVQRAFDEIVISLAPFIEQIGNGLSAAIGQSGQGFTKWGNTALSVIKAVAKATAFLMDVWSKAQNLADAFVGGIAHEFGKAVGDDALAAGGKQVVLDAKKDFDKPFGMNRQAVDEFFAAFDAGLMNSKKLQDRITKLSNPGAVNVNTSPDFKPIAAVLKDSQDAAAIAARFDMDGQRQEDIQKRQLAVQQQLPGLLIGIKDAVMNLPILKEI